MTEDREEIANCSFCGRPPEDSLLVVRGNVKGTCAYICDKCIDICRDMVGHKRMENQKPVDINPANNTH